MHPKDHWASVLGVASKESPGGVVWFVSNALPFGGTACVWHFNRAAAAFRKILNTLLLLPTANYYDDFPLVVPSCLAPLADEAMRACARLCGWRWKVGKKDKEFASAFDVLGVTADLSKAVSEGTLVLRNTERRVAELQATIKIARQE